MTWILDSLLLCTASADLGGNAWTREELFRRVYIRSTTIGGQTIFKATGLKFEQICSFWCLTVEIASRHHSRVPGALVCLPSRAESWGSGEG